MTLATLCSGIDIFALAAEAVGWEVLFQVEIEKRTPQFLEYRYPHAHRYADIKTTDLSAWRGAVDVVAFGDPCQPHSTSGKRLGAADPRYLWPDCLRAVKEVQPLWVVNENVHGSLLNGTVDRKIDDLEAAGYACWPPLLIPAAAGHAIHFRRRVFLVAYAAGAGWRKQQAASEPSPAIRQHAPYPWPTAPMGRKARDAYLRGLVREADGTAEGLRPGFRNWAIHAIGNSIYYPIAEWIFREIDRIENTTA